MRIWNLFVNWVCNDNIRMNRSSFTTNAYILYARRGSGDDYFVVYHKERECFVVTIKYPTVTEWNPS